MRVTNKSHTPMHVPREIPGAVVDHVKIFDTRLSARDEKDRFGRRSDG